MARYWPIAAAALLTIAAAPPPPDSDLPGKQPGSESATNMAPSNTHTVWSPSLPVPMIDEDAPPSAFLKAAAAALAAGHTGEAQEAMERAESRALDRSVRPSTANQPSRQTLVTQISKARDALAAGDRKMALMLVQAAAADPQAR